MTKVFPSGALNASIKRNSPPPGTQTTIHSLSTCNPQALQACPPAILLYHNSVDWIQSITNVLSYSSAGLKFSVGLAGLKIKVAAGFHSPLEALEEDAFICLRQLLVATRTPSLTPPSSACKTSMVLSLRNTLSSHLLLTLPLPLPNPPLPFKDLWSHWTHLDNPG